MFFNQKIRFSMLKLKILDPKILIEDSGHILIIPWSIFIPFSPLSPEKAWFISQIVRIAHNIRNCFFNIYISSFHYLINFWAIWIYHIWSCLESSLQEKLMFDLKDFVKETLEVTKLYDEYELSWNWRFSQQIKIKQHDKWQTTFPWHFVDRPKNWYDTTKIMNKNLNDKCCVS